MNRLPPDPVIDEIRQIRHEISARFDHDPKRLVDHYLELQQRFQDRIETPRAGGARAAEPGAKPGR